jgi:hypothetical protein
MIALKTNNKVLELAAGASLSITASNPAFDKDFVDRVFSFPFKIALSPNNLAAVKHFNRFDSKRPGQTPATVYIDNFTVSPGYLNILSVTETEIESTFQNEAIQWLATIKELKVRALMPVITIPRIVETHWVLSIQATPPCQYAVTINGVQYSHFHTPPGFGQIPAATFPRLSSNKRIRLQANGTARTMLLYGKVMRLVNYPFTGLNTLFQLREGYWINLEFGNSATRIVLRRISN